MKRRLIILLILAVIGAGIYFIMTRPPAAITLTGIVTTDEVIVSSQIAGRLENLPSHNINQGDLVTVGQLLADIHPAEYQADINYYENTQKQAATQVSQSQTELRFQELQSQNQIVQAQANLASAQAQVAQATAELENLRLTFERTEALYKTHVESAGAYDQSRTAYDAGRAHLLSLNKLVLASQAGLDLAKATQLQITMRKAAVEMNEHQLAAVEAQQNKARVLLSYTKILAPLSGVIDQRTALPGEVVTPGQAIFTIINLDDLWVRADVEETYITHIHLGDKMHIRLPSDEMREGTVFYIAKDAEFATQRDVSRTKRDIKTFEIRLRCDNSHRDLAVGMTAYVILPLVDTTSQTAPAK